ncbi:MAG: sulfite exporter TauE/SafE family protein [Pseudolabrys sp.]
MSSLPSEMAAIHPGVWLVSNEGRRMAVSALIIFLLTAFFGGIVTGLAGFAMGLVVSGVWLHILTPAETAVLIAGYGLITQPYSIWRLRHALNWRAVAPFVLGGIVGVPIGTYLLTYADPDYLRTGVGVLLIAYSTYSLARPHLKPMHASFPVETVVGFFNGILGGLTGLSGPIITMWCALRGWPKDMQRSVYQPVILSGFVLTMISFAVSGKITWEVARIYSYGVIPLAAGVWLGLRLYGHLDEAAFRKIVLVLLLLSGLALIVPFY